MLNKKYAGKANSEACKSKKKRKNDFLVDATYAHFDNWSKWMWKKFTVPHYCRTVADPQRDHTNPKKKPAGLHTAASIHVYGEFTRTGQLGSCLVRILKL